MCTVVLRLRPGLVEALLVRDELLDRPTAPYGRHWPDLPDVVGQRDLEAGGTAAAIDLARPRFAAVLNGWEPDVHGVLAPAPPPPGAVRSRGRLPLEALRGRPLDDLSRTAPFHLVTVGARASVDSWVQGRLTRADLDVGDHVVVNAGPDPAGDPKGERVAAAVRRLPAAGDDWSGVVEAALVAPVTVAGHRYGTRSLTRVRLDAGTTAVWEAVDLAPGTGWRRVR